MPIRFRPTGLRLSSSKARDGTFGAPKYACARAASSTDANPPTARDSAASPPEPHPAPPLPVDGPSLDNATSPTEVARDSCRLGAAQEMVSMARQESDTECYAPLDLRAGRSCRKRS